MQITVNISQPDEDQDQLLSLLSLDIYPDMTVETLRNSISAETSIPPEAQNLYHNGQLLNDGQKTMQDLSITDGEVLLLHVRDMRGNAGIETAGAGLPRRTQSSAVAAPSRGSSHPYQDPELLRLQIMGNPQLRAEALRRQPELASVLDDPQRFAALFNASYERDRQERLERQRQIAMLNDDLNPESQARIEEMIRQERVMENLQAALEYIPEVFGRVHMLYIDVEVNDRKVKALVDSGAQTTIMSPECAQECGIMRLVDRRFAGIVRGVGTASILGRVHAAQIKIGTVFLICSFTVMEGKGVDMLLGLDMLKRHQACIDLANDRLVIQGVSVPFLGEADIPKGLEEELQAEPTIKGPGGTTIGARSGTISGPYSSASGSEGGPGPSSAAAAAGAAAAARAAAAAAAAAQAIPPRPQFPQESIDRLVALGVSQEEAINALQATGGNVEYAAGLLFPQ